MSAHAAPRAPVHNRTKIRRDSVTTKMSNEWCMSGSSRQRCAVRSVRKLVRGFVLSDSGTKEHSYESATLSRFPRLLVASDRVMVLRSPSTPSCKLVH